MSTDAEQLQYPTIPLTEQLSCPICTTVLQRPVELSCGVIICSTCCSKWVVHCTAQRHEIYCPCCHSHLLDKHSIRPPPPLVLSLLAGVLVNCGRGCGKLVRVDNYDKHIAGNCQGYYHHQVDSPSKMTLHDVLAKPVTVPATPAEIRVAGHLMKRMLDSDPDEHIVRVPTRGQVSMMHCIHLNKGSYSKYTCTANYLGTSKWMLYFQFRSD